MPYDDGGAYDGGACRTTAGHAVRRRRVPYDDGVPRIRTGLSTPPLPVSPPIQGLLPPLPAAPTATRALRRTAQPGTRGPVGAAAASAAPVFLWLNLLQQLYADAPAAPGLSAAAPRQRPSCCASG